MSAFKLAISHQADAIELDAKLSSDEQVVVIHDMTVDRTTSGRGLVKQLSFQKIKQLEAGGHFDPSFRGEQIPALAEVFEEFGGKIFINIELTNYNSPNDPLPERVVDLVKKFKVEESILFSSFNPIALIRLKRRLASIPVALLADEQNKGFWARTWIGHLLGYQALHPHYGDVNSKLIKKLHQRGKRVHAYTVNDPEEMRRLFRIGINGIFTDDPPVARQILMEARVK